MAVFRPGNEETTMSTYELNRTVVVPVAHGHRAQQGFCTVCGSVWPCYRALPTDLSELDRHAAPAAA
jgi:hypothetical protein